MKTLIAGSQKRPSVAKAPQAVLPDFNLDTKPMKYFDSSLDPKFKKESEPRQAKKGTNGQALIEEDTAGGKTTIGFTKPNGLIGSKFEVFKSVEALKQEQESKTNYASKQYKELHKVIAGSSSKKNLKPAFSPESSEKKISPQKRNIRIEKPGEARDQDTKDIQIVEQT